LKKELNRVFGVRVTTKEDAIIIIMIPSQSKPLKGIFIVALMSILATTIAMHDAEEPVERCSSHTPDQEEANEQMRLVEQYRMHQPQGRTDMVVMRIPIVFHVIYTSTNQGKLSAASIKNQIDVLNQAYRGNTDSSTSKDGRDAGIEFYHNATKMIQNDDWFTNCKSGSYTFRPQHTLDTSVYINVFTCSGDGYLGWTWLPWTHGEGSNYQALVMNYKGFPNGGYSKYSEGYTLVHEMGHYFGLLHTFSRGTCTVDGDDGVADTPMEARSGSSCGTNYNDYSRDSCTDDPGPDPLWSFMDYSYDLCMKRFSPGQVSRMREMIELHRPKLLSNNKIGNMLTGVPPTTTPVNPTGKPTPRPTLRPTPRPTPPPTSRPTLKPTQPLPPTGKPTLKPTGVEVNVGFTSVPSSVNLGEDFIVKVSYWGNQHKPFAFQLALVDADKTWVAGSTSFIYTTGSATGSVSIPMVVKDVPADKVYTLKVKVALQSDVVDGLEYSELLATAKHELYITGGDMATEMVNVCSNLMSAIPSSWKIQIPGSGVCSGAKDIDGNCFSISSYDDAEAKCVALGARICSSDEVLRGITKNVGCGANNNYMWTSDKCETGHMIKAPVPDNKPDVCASDTVSSALFYSIKPRCCADDVFVTKTDSNTVYNPPTPSPVAEESDCVDASGSENCDKWAEIGYCKSNSLYFHYMKENCAKSCEFCTESKSNKPLTVAPSAQCALIADVKGRCDNVNKCCNSEKLICTVKGNRRKMHCLVKTPAKGMEHVIGDVCHIHRHCQTKYCDKRGYYGTAWRCASPRAKNSALSGNEDEQSDSSSADEAERDTIITVTVGLVGALLIVAAIIGVYKYNKIHQIAETNPTTSFVVAESE